MALLGSARATRPRWRLAHVARAVGARLGQDAHGRRVDPSASRIPPGGTHGPCGAHGRRRARRDDRGAIRGPCGLRALGAALVRAEQAPPHVAQRRHGDGVLGRRTRPASWPATRRRLVRRTGELALPRRLGPAALRAPTWLQPPPGGYHHAPADASRAGPHGRGDDHRHPWQQLRKQGQPGGGLLCPYHLALRRHAPGAPGNLRRDPRGCARRPYGRGS